MSANKILTILAAGIGLSGSVLAQQSLETDYRRTGKAVTAIFEAQRQVLQTSSAVIRDGRKEIGYGVVISGNGYILTKASEISSATALTVTVDQQTYPDAKVLQVDPAWDVALIKVEANGLIPVTYASTSDVPQGTWVVANGATTRTSRRLLAGIVSAKIREIPATGGAALGVVLNAKSKALTIDKVDDKSDAKEAGVVAGDIILSIDGKKVKKSEDLAEALKGHKAGDAVKLTLKRKEEEITLEVRLMTRGEMLTDQMNRNDQMSGDFSARRSGFPRIMQHDILGNSKIVGGPLLDLEGRCLGMNIARANRAESFAIPVEDLKKLAEEMVKKIE
ncbi:MAG: PDZ domain-containing protein [Akkermansiaceae bacterium]|nr:PDZ domain-containing protein [Akkermansiaceae bacterium]